VKDEPVFADLQRALAEKATDEAADTIRTHTRCLRGIRGVASGPLAELVAATWKSTPAELPRDREALDRLFGTAWEDGLAAIGLLAAALPDDPETALSLGLGWAGRTDDLLTADSLGWLVLGPAVARLGGSSLREMLYTLQDAPPFPRRAAAATALAFVPAEIEGPAAAALRERAGSRHVRMVEQVSREEAGQILREYAHDLEPMIQKVQRRVLRVWADSDPEGLIAWAASMRGGLPKMLSGEVQRIKPRKRGRS
jgi:hypothetical protein